MEIFLDAAVFRVKVDNDLGGISIYHKESIFPWREKRLANGKREGAIICVGAWFQYLLVLLVVYYVNFAPPGDKFWKGGGVKYVLVLIPSN